jgi:hypothetical protein
MLEHKIELEKEMGGKVYDEEASYNVNFPEI